MFLPKYLVISLKSLYCLLAHPNIKQVTTRYDVLDGHGVYFKKGVSPEQLFWAKCFCGDTKDNVLGIHKLGEVKDQKTGKVFKKLLEEATTVKDLIDSLQEMVDAGKGGMRLPDYSSQGINHINSVEELFYFNCELKRPYTSKDLDEEDIELLKEQVKTQKVSWDEEGFIQKSFEVLGQSIVVSDNIKQFFNLREAL